MQVKNTFKGNKEIVKQGIEDLGMANAKYNQSNMQETKLYNLKMAPKYII